MLLVLIRSASELEALPMSTQNVCFCEEIRKLQMYQCFPDEFELEFYSSVNTIKVMWNRSVYLTTLLLGRLSG